MEINPGGAILALLIIFAAFYLFAFALVILATSSKRNKISLTKKAVLSLLLAIVLMFLTYQIRRNKESRAIEPVDTQPLKN